MPYRHIEEIRDRRGEKLAFFITAENLADIVVLGLPVYVGTVFLEMDWLRVVLVIAAALLLAIQAYLDAQRRGADEAPTM